MRELLALIPDPDALLSLGPEELGGKLLFVVRNRGAGGLFHPDTCVAELFDALHAENPYPQNKREEIEKACIEAWAWLGAQGLVVPAPGMNGQNGHRFLSRRAIKFESQEDFSGFIAARLLPKEALHSSIAEPVWLAFVRGDYDVAVFLAMKQVEVAIRTAANESSALVGVKLARAAFQPEQGPLTDMEAEGGERQARMDLFAGALGSYKNPQSHRHVALIDPIEAIEQIMLASHLLRVVDSRAAAKNAPAKA